MCVFCAAILGGYGNGSDAFVGVAALLITILLLNCIKNDAFILVWIP